ncbi:MAG: hypothetical protein GXX96_01615 [Planctomycetaceae bacterium]|nr:hypothetical protein [Planctomycetaceae bacterium]
MRLPGLDMPGAPIRLTLWFAPLGSHVERGEPILEVTSGAVTIDFPAPASGLLAERLVAEDEPVEPGTLLAIIDTER